MVYKKGLCRIIRCQMRIIDSIKERFELAGLGLALFLSPFLLKVKDKRGGF